MIACFVRYETDSHKAMAFEEYARNWGQAIPRCGADLLGCFAPHGGSTTTACGLCTVPSLAACRARLREDPAGRADFDPARRGRFVLKEGRVFLRLAPAPHAPLVRP